MHPKAVFLDKDGTLIENAPYNVDPERIVLAPRAIEALQMLRELDFELLVVTNQPGIALGYFSSDALDAVEDRLRELLAEHKIPLAGFYFCPHHPQGTVARFRAICECRKPAPGLLFRAARQRQLDLGASWFIGDILDDVEAGNRAGCRTVLVDCGGETEWRLTPLRQPTLVAADLYSAARQIAAAESTVTSPDSVPA
ncbi:MAG TPA: HAD family hydrolase [Pirellulales bacterium]|nr:HAD family hydrolase [Pirellulales bacterium]